MPSISTPKKPRVRKVRESSVSAIVSTVGSTAKEAADPMVITSVKKLVKFIDKGTDREAMYIVFNNVMRELGTPRIDKFFKFMKREWKTLRVVLPSLADHTSEVLGDIDCTLINNYYPTAKSLFRTWEQDPAEYYKRVGVKPPELVTDVTEDPLEVISRLRALNASAAETIAKQRVKIKTLASDLEDEHEAYRRLLPLALKFISAHSIDRDQFIEWARGERAIEDVSRMVDYIEATAKGET